MTYVGIDIGSTASKVIVRGDRDLHFTMPTGWNSKDTSARIHQRLLELGIDTGSSEVVVVATGYGRVSVEYADKVVTEITCHARGGYHMALDDCTIIDIGGQDTKIINVENGIVTDFLMNDKCSAGTGKFIEIMANRLNLTIDELFGLAEIGEVINISSLCTVFAETEIINYMGEGKKRDDIAAGVVDSVASKVLILCQRMKLLDRVILTGGLSHNEFFADVLSRKLKRKVDFQLHGRYAGALGAALMAEKDARG